MKITIEIPDPLLSQARRFAKHEGVTLKALFELGLRKVVDEKLNVPAFQQRDASFKGKGLRPEFRSASWQAIREAAYSGRGG